MNLELLFEDGVKGNCVKDNSLNEEYLYSIVNRDGKYNVYVLDFINNSLTKLGKLFNEDYSNIKIETIRKSYTTYDWDGSCCFGPYKGFVCTLPDKTIEVYYFISRDAQRATKIFSKEDKIVDFEQVFLYHGQCLDNPYYIVKHLDGTKSLVNMELHSPEEGLKYVVSHALKMENKNNDGRISITEAKGVDQISYTYNLHTFRKSNIRTQNGQFAKLESSINENYNNLQSPKKR